MTQRRALNLAMSALALAGLLFITAGASVPDESTITLGTFALLSALAVLLGLNWPMPRPNNVYSLDEYRARRAAMPIESPKRAGQRR